jgi:ABC-type polar amino acid transport system ATPase subunit
MDIPVIEIKNLKKSFGKVAVLDGINLIEEIICFAE